MSCFVCLCMCCCAVSSVFAHSEGQAATAASVLCACGAPVPCSTVVSIAGLLTAVCGATYLYSMRLGSTGLQASTGRLCWASISPASTGVAPACCVACPGLALVFSAAWKRHRLCKGFNCDTLVAAGLAAASCLLPGCRTLFVNTRSQQGLIIKSQATNRLVRSSRPVPL